MHVGLLTFSALCYFVAYIVIGENPSEVDEIAKLGLWYLPLVVEVIGHFVTSFLPERIAYPPEQILARSATLFIIILGGGERPSGSNSTPRLCLSQGWTA